MPTFGDHLKQIRELKGFSIEDLSRVSKINPRLLMAIEAEDFDALPGGVFNRGFVKTYAKYCGFSEKDLLSEYEHTLKQMSGPELQLLPVEPKAAPGESQAFGKRASIVTAMVILVAVGALLYFHFSRNKPDQKTNVESAAVQPETAVPQNAAPQPETSVPPPVLPSNPSDATGAGAGPPADSTSTSNVAGSSKAESTPPVVKSETEPLTSRPGAGALSQQRKSASPAGQESPASASEIKSAEEVIVKGRNGALSLQIVAKDNTWLSIRRDGQEVYRKIMLSNETLRFTAKNKFDIVCGNAGGVTFTVDGKTMPPLGGPGEVKTVTYERPVRP